MKSLKIVFAGTPDFAKIMLQSILNSTHEVVSVFTQPDRPSGRGLKIHPSPVKELALENQIPILQPHSLKLDGKYPDEAKQAQEYLKNCDFDVMVVAAYGLILPTWLLEFAQTKSPLACINVHASLLPRWRGAAPIHRAIWTGDTLTGTCIMKMAEGLDTGPIIRNESLAIEKNETTKTLHDRLAKQGAQLLLEVLDSFACGEEIKFFDQSSLGTTYAHKILKDEAMIDWQQNAKTIDRQIRALNPAPGAMTYLDGIVYKLWLSKDVSELWKETLKGSPGEILAITDEGMDIACGSGVIRILEIQKAGAKRIAANQIKQSKGITAGQRFN